MEKILTTQQIAETLQVSTRTIYRWVEAGKLPARKIGKDYRFLESDLERIMQ